MSLCPECQALHPDSDVGHESERRRPRAIKLPVEPYDENGEALERTASWSTTPVMAGTGRTGPRAAVPAPSWHLQGIRKR